MRPKTITLIAVAAALLVMLLFPPWHAVTPGRAIPLGYGFFASSPAYTYTHGLKEITIHGTVDLKLLITQAVFASVIACAVLFATKS